MSVPVSLPAEVRARLRRIALAPRLARGDRGFGLHASRSRGAGLEFAQYRAYEPGDELRQIDWKLYARSDRFFVREAERESPLTVWIVLDASASMNQRDGERGTRFDAARRLTACIAELALRQGDRFGLLVLHGDGVRLVSPGNGVRQRDQLLLALHGLTAGGTFPVAEKLAPVWERIGAGDLVIALSDGFDEAMVALIERLAAARREVLAIRILTVEERDFHFEGGHLFRDIEGDVELRGDGAAMRAGFLERFGAARREQTAGLAAAGVRQVEYVLDEPLDLPLRRLFADAAQAGASAP